ncbi:MAG: GTP-binding protein [Cytophagales bacterium]
MIPITLISGFLGAGKTTLLNSIIVQNPDKKVIVIENEFGEIGVDGALLIELDAQIFELSNGCICCNLNEDLQETLLKIVNLETKPDHLIIETTGIADPAPIIISLLNDEIIQSNFRIDSVITLIDALNFKNQINQNPVSIKQLSYANFIVVNKIATIHKNDLVELMQEIANYNPGAELYATNFAFVKDINLLELNLFDELKLSPKESRSFTMLNNSPYERKIVLDSSVTHKVKSISISTDHPLDILKFNTWLSALLQNSFGNIYRVKGFVVFEDFEHFTVIQGVQNTFVTEQGRSVGASNFSVSELVFIGVNLEKEFFQKGLELCVYNEDEINFEKLYDNIENIQNILLQE